MSGNRTGTARERLSLAIVEMATERRRTPCSYAPELWVSEDPREREIAAQRCLSCSVIDLCREAGEGEEWNVWGGVDRTVEGDAELVAA